MPVDRLEPLSQSQKSKWNIVINERHVIQPHTWYTCPAGKTAIVNYRFKGDGLGAASEIRLEANGVRLATWQSTSGIFTTPDNATISSLGWQVLGSFASGEISLNAGEAVITSQDSGTNGEFNGFLQIQELDL